MSSPSDMDRLHRIFYNYQSHNDLTGTDLNYLGLITYGETESLMMAGHIGDIMSSTIDDIVLGADPVFTSGGATELQLLMPLEVP